MINRHHKRMSEVQIKNLPIEVFLVFYNLKFHKDDLISQLVCLLNKVTKKF